MTTVRLTPQTATPIGSAIYRLGHRLAVGPDGPPVSLALEDVSQATGFERILVLVDAGCGFEVVGARGLPAAREHLARAPLAAAVVSLAAEERQVVFAVPGMTIAGLDAKSELEAMDARMIVGVPLTACVPAIERERRRELSESAPVVVYLETTVSRDGLTLAERALIALVARQALTGFVASRLFVEAAIDTTTGAYARGHFERALKEEVIWARETRAQLTVLVLSLVGGGAGATRERSLARAAEVVRAALRSNDVIARYGPDELVAMLPGAGPEAAQVISRRIAARLAAASLAGYVGGASFPQHAESAQLLLGRADQAAVAAAASGRPLLWSSGLPEVPGRTERLAALLTGEAAADYRRVQALLETSHAVNQTRDSGEVMAAALKSVLGLTGADRALVLCGAGESLSIEAGLDRSGEEVAPSAVYSRSIARQVLRTGRAMCLRDTSARDTRETARLLDLRSVLCVPLKAAGITLGVLYVDSINATYDLSERDLSFFEALASHVALALENARQSEKLRDENAVLRRSQHASHPVQGMVGESLAMRQVIQALDELAPSGASVLISGESGSGKELAARALHQLGPSPGGPFIAQSCAAMAQDLLESELFGHLPGAFSGAARLKKGLLELAHGGTLFLDAIDQLDLLLQAKLLRALEERSLRRLGDTRAIPIELRLVAATSKDLKAEVEAGRFRADLYHRLNALGLTLPALRERREDIPLLVEHFGQNLAETRGLVPPVLTRPALAALLAHDWPGNVRELMNAIEKGMLLAAGGELEPKHLGLEPAPEPVAAASGKLRDALEDTERSLVRAALAEHAGNVTHAARQLGVARQQLQRLIKKYELR